LVKRLCKCPIYCKELVMRQHIICNPFSTQSLPILHLHSTHSLYPILYPLFTRSLPILYPFCTQTLPTISTHFLCPILFTLSTHSLPILYPFSTHSRPTLPTLFPLSIPTLCRYTTSVTEPAPKGAASFGRSRRHNAMRLRLRRLQQWYLHG
jgi:hypothetical protein